MASPTPHGFAVDQQRRFEERNNKEGGLKHRVICLPLLLVGRATAQPTAPQSIAATQFPTPLDPVWMRTDGRRMTGDFTLQQMFFQAQHECTDNNRQPAVVSENCMKSKGYVYASRPTQ